MTGSEEQERDSSLRSAMAPRLDARAVKLATRCLPVDARRRMGEDIKTVQLGWPLGMPLVRKMEPGL